MKLPTLALLLVTARAAEVSKKPSEEVAVERPDDLDAPSLEFPALAPYDFEATESERDLQAASNVATDGICGDDNRSHASYKAVGTFYLGSDNACKCTAFLISKDIFLSSSGCLLAGELIEGCPVTDESEVHFNFNGHFADAHRRFSVDLDSFESYGKDDQGQAWAAGRLHRNIFTHMTAGATVGSDGFELGYVPPEEVVAPVRVVGYGTYRDRQEKGIGNMEDEYVPGFDLVYFQADAGDGFGGPVIDTDQQKVVGIYTSGRCKYGESNIATPIDSNSLNDYITCLRNGEPAPEGSGHNGWKDGHNGKGCDWVAQNPTARCRRWSEIPRRDGGRKATKACIRACCGVGYD